MYTLASALIVRFEERHRSIMERQRLKERQFHVRKKESLGQTVGLPGAPVCHFSD